MTTSRKPINKLVRDRILEILEGKKILYSHHIAGADEYAEALNNKLHEEVLEFEAAKTFDAKLLELADIAEVMQAIEANMPGVYDGHAAMLRKLADDTRVTLSAIEGVRLDRLRDRGGFKKKIILEWTEQ